MRERAGEDVVVYTTPTCPFCTMAKRYLEDRSVAYVAKDVSADDVALREMVAKTGQYGVPVIRVGDQAMIGWDKDEFERLLHG